jgi:hypothetical protein
MYVDEVYFTPVAPIEPDPENQIEDKNYQGNSNEVTRVLQFPLWSVEH